ncbi:C-3 sterol dehydrogenase [Clavulina sp. PMI_390]|nr:C-3 sterol dehydrogenase [Clavulina sp. PMI_390]
MPESYLVVGGSGFLGRHIVEALVARGDTVSVFDIVQKHFDVPFYPGDISKEQDVGDAIKKSGATCIFHTAAPAAANNPPKGLYRKVNVEGTKTVLACAAAYKVPKVVYTSSAGNVYNGTDLIDCDERMTVPKEQVDEYNVTKVEAERLVLAANGQDGLHTVALRPSGIFGPGDRQAIPGMGRVMLNNQMGFQIGDNVNLFDWTYVGNVVKAHLLAADKLLDPPLSIEAITSSELEGVKRTVGNYTIPVSGARPPGPALEITPEIEKAYFAFKEGAQPKTRVRSRFDPLTPENLELEPNFPLQVAGQMFFITNGEPMYFWDFTRAVWAEMGADVPSQAKAWKIPPGFGMVLGSLAQWWSGLMGKEPGLTKDRIFYVTTHRWFNIEKARRVLGYEPDVGIEEGIKLAVAWWKEDQAKNAQKA